MMKRFLLHRYREFTRNIVGSTPIITAILLLPLMLSVGGAIDYSRATKAKVGLQLALDAAALAGANVLVREGGTKEEVEQAVADVFRASVVDANAKGAMVKSIEIVQNPENGEVKVGAIFSVPTSFMQLAGLTSVDIGTKSTAKLSDQDIELVMMLDLTGSMNGAKIIDLQAAARDLVDVLIPRIATKFQNEVRIGLVPYSQGVNAGSFASIATNGASSRCATERAGIGQFDDISYKTAPLGDGSTRCPDAQIFPLSNSNKDLHKQISGFSTGGYTAGHTGIGWTWYMLSPKWSSLWPAASTPVSYEDKKTIKIAVLMTDGQFNTAYDYEPEKNTYRELKGYSSRKSQNRAKNLCREMKQKGILVYSVTFRLRSGSSKNMMKECASGTAKYYDAANGSALRSAFATIAADISELRITE